MDLPPPHLIYRLNASLSYLETGASVARVRVYGDPKPPTSSSPVGSAILLIDQILTKPCGSIIGTDLVLTLGAASTVIASGVATWFRILNSNGDPAGDGDVTSFAGQGEMKLTPITLTVGRRFTMSVSRLT